MGRYDESVCGCFTATRSHLTILLPTNTVLTVMDDMGETANSSMSITVTESAEGCISNCLSVDQITMSYKKKTGQINGNIQIIDENGSRVANAGVHAMWILPDGVSEIDAVAVTGKR